MALIDLIDHCNDKDISSTCVLQFLSVIQGVLLSQTHRFPFFLLPSQSTIHLFPHCLVHLICKFTFAYFSANRKCVMFFVVRNPFCCFSLHVRWLTPTDSRFGLGTALDLACDCSCSRSPAARRLWRMHGFRTLVFSGLGSKMPCVLIDTS